MNPHWIQAISATAQRATRKCPHCGRKGVYPPKQPGQYHLCKHCQHRFREKERPRDAA
jgi:DNA-directed RNA polymerase subunit RPC12/RpoP